MNHMKVNQATENYHPLLPFTSVSWRILASFSSLFWLYNIMHLSMIHSQTHLHYLQQQTAVCQASDKPTQHLQPSMTLQTEEVISEHNGAFSSWKDKYFHRKCSNWHFRQTHRRWLEIFTHATSKSYSLPFALWCCYRDHLIRCHAPYLQPTCLSLRRSQTSNPPSPPPSLPVSLQVSYGEFYFEIHNLINYPKLAAM